MFFFNIFTIFAIVFVEITMDLLLNIQIASLLLTLFIGLMMALSRVHVTTPVHRYETSRWFMVCAMGILVIHYLLQIIFGFRKSGDDVGAVVNILFYAPVTYLISFSIVNLSSIREYRKRYVVFSFVSYLTIILTFLTGIIIYRSLHMGPVVYVMGVEFFLSIWFAIINPLKETKRIRSILVSNTANDLSNYNTIMITGTIQLLIISFMVPGIIFHRPLLFVVGPIFLVLLFIYCVNFVCLGFNFKSVADVLDSQELEPAQALSETPANDNSALSDKEIQSIEKALNEWISIYGFANPDITLGKLAKQTGYTTQDLGAFISIKYGTTFRVWLSKVRLDQAKHMLISRPDATVETIAEDCGFTSRSYFQTLFHNETGFTPREWRSKF